MTKTTTQLSGLACPSCGGKLALSFTRQRPGYTYRRRHCIQCGQKASTAERIIGTADHERYVRVPQIVTSVHELLATCGISLSDLQVPVMIPTTEEKP